MQALASQFAQSMSSESAARGEIGRQEGKPVDSAMSAVQSMLGGLLPLNPTPNQLAHNEQLAEPMSSLVRSGVDVGMLRQIVAVVADVAGEPDLAQDMLDILTSDEIKLVIQLLSEAWLTGTLTFSMVARHLLDQSQQEAARSMQIEYQAGDSKLTAVDIGKIVQFISRMRAPGARAIMMVVQRSLFKALRSGRFGPRMFVDMIREIANVLRDEAKKRQPLTAEAIAMPVDRLM